MRIEVLSRCDIEGLPLPKVSHAVISITDPDKPEASLRTNRETKGVLRLQFDDATYKYHPDCVLFTQDMATQIKCFLEQMIPVNYLIVHCEAGISRSAAVAQAVRKVIPESKICYDYRHNPNPLVLRLLSQALES